MLSHDKSIPNHSEGPGPLPSHGFWMTPFSVGGAKSLLKTIERKSMKEGSALSELYQSALCGFGAPRCQDAACQELLIHLDVLKRNPQLSKASLFTFWFPLGPLIIVEVPKSFQKGPIQT